MNIQYRITRHPADISKSAARYSLFAFSILFSAVNSNALTPAIIPNIHNVSIKSIIVYSYIYEVADVGLRDYHFYIFIVCLIKITYGVRYLHSTLFLSFVCWCCWYCALFTFIVIILSTPLTQSRSLFLGVHGCIFFRLNHFVTLLYMVRVTASTQSPHPRYSMWWIDKFRHLYLHRMYPSIHYLHQSLIHLRYILVSFRLCTSTYVWCTLHHLVLTLLQRFHSTMVFFRTLSCLHLQLLHFDTNVLPLFVGVKIALILISVVSNLVIHTV
nr:MAG TPA: hypothetical protein [Caudoviricetes sp.]